MVFNTSEAATKRKAAEAGSIREHRCHHKYSPVSGGDSHAEEIRVSDTAAELRRAEPWAAPSFTSSRVMWDPPVTGGMGNVRTLGDASTAAPRTHKVEVGFSEPISYHPGASRVFASGPNTSPRSAEKGEVVKTSWYGKRATREKYS